VRIRRRRKVHVRYISSANEFLVYFCATSYAVIKNDNIRTVCCETTRTWSHRVLCSTCVGFGWQTS